MHLNSTRFHAPQGRTGNHTTTGPSTTGPNTTQQNTATHKKLFLLGLSALSLTRAQAHRSTTRTHIHPQESRALRFSYALPTDGRAYCNKINATHAFAHQEECVYLHRTPDYVSDSDSGSSCFAYASYDRELGILDYDQSSRPIFRSIALPSQNNFWSAPYMGGITPEGELLYDIRPYCQRLMIEEDDQIRLAQQKLSTLDNSITHTPINDPEHSPAYEVCAKGSSYFAHWWRYEDGGGYENYFGKTVVFALPGVTDSESDTETCITSTDKDGRKTTTCIPATCSAYAWAPSVVGIKEHGQLIASHILLNSANDYVLSESGAFKIEPFCRRYDTELSKVFSDWRENASYLRDGAPAKERGANPAQYPSTDLREMDGMCDIELVRLESFEKTKKWILMSIGAVIAACGVLQLASPLYRAYSERHRNLNTSRNRNTGSRRANERTPLVPPRPRYDEPRWVSERLRLNQPTQNRANRYRNVPTREPASTQGFKPYSELEFIPKNAPDASGTVDPITRTPYEEMISNPDKYQPSRIVYNKSGLLGSRSQDTTAQCYSYNGLKGLFKRGATTAMDPVRRSKFTIPEIRRERIPKKVAP